MKEGVIGRWGGAGTILAFSGNMSGRRSHTRFAMVPSPEGVLRVLRDVVIQNTSNEHIVAISREPGVLGESVSVQLSAHDDSAVPARVLESHPIVVDGSVRHQLRLHRGLVE